MKKQRGSPSGEVGQTLLEILLAFSVLVMVLSAVVFGIATSLSNTQYTKNQGLANSYAQEGMAVIRKIRDSSLNDFSTHNLGDLTSGAKYCINKNLELKEIAFSGNCLTAGYGIEDNGVFSREATFERNSSVCLDATPAVTPAAVSGTNKVTVRVSWTDSKCPAGANNPLCHSVELVTCFSNTDKKISP